MEGKMPRKSMFVVVTMNWKQIFVFGILLCLIVIPAAEAVKKIPTPIPIIGIGIYSKSS